MELDTRIIDLTLGELLNAIEEQTKQIMSESKKTDALSERYVYGIPGIMKLYNCSRSTAHRIKTSGKIDHAISQIGGKMVIDVQLALHALPAK